MANFQSTGSQIPDAWSIKLTFSLKNNLIVIVGVNAPTYYYALNQNSKTVCPFSKLLKHIARSKG